MYEETQLYHSEEAVNQYMAEKETNPDGILHKKFKNKLRDVYLQIQMEDEKSEELEMEMQDEK